MLWQREFRVSLEVAIQASCGIFGRVYDELAPTATDGDVFTSGSVARLAASQTLDVRALEVQPGMRTGRKNAADICMTIVARLIANKDGAFDGRRTNNCMFNRGAGDQQDATKSSNGAGDRQREIPCNLHSG